MVCPHREGDKKRSRPNLSRSERNSKVKLMKHSKMKRHFLSLLIAGLAVTSLGARAQSTPAKPSELSAAAVSAMSAADKNKALGRACGEGRVDDVKRLLSSGADINTDVEEGMSPIQVAAYKGHVDVVKILLAMGAGANPSATTKAGRFPTILMAVASGNVEVVKLLQAAGASLNSKNEMGLIPIFLAAESSAEMLQFILKNGANPNTIGPDGDQPLLLAARADKTDSVKLLLAAGVNVNVARSDGRQAIHFSADNGNADMTRALLAAGANPNAEDKSGDQPIRLAAAASSAETLKTLIGAGARADSVVRGHRSPLVAAVEHVKTDNVRTLLAAGAKANATDEDGMQAIHFVGKSPEIVSILLAAGAQINATDAKGRVPLHYAAQHGTAEGIREMIKSGAQLNAVDREGKQPIQYASNGGSKAALSEIVASGANAGVSDKDGITPLMFAVIQFDLDAIKLLLSRGADVLAADKDGRQAIHFSVRNDHEKITPALLAAGAKFDVSDNKGRQPLHIAAQRGSINTVKLLIAAGAKLDVQDIDGWTPLHFAASEYGNKFVVDALLKAGAAPHIKSKSGEMPFAIAAKATVQDREMLARLRHAALLIPGILLAEKAQALCQAAKGYGDSSVEELLSLLKGGAKADTACEFGYQPIHHAAGAEGAKAVEMVKILLAGGADIEARTHIKGTPLHAAVFQPNNAVVKYLLDSGARLDPINSDGNTPIQSASGRSGDHGLTVRLLVKAGASLNDPDKNGQSPLHLAANGGHPNTVKVLLQLGAKRNALNKQGQEPIEVAMNSGRKDSKEIASLFLESNSPQDEDANEYKLARIEKKYDITRALQKEFYAQELGYDCNERLMGFPERYDDLNNPSNAHDNWDKAYSLARSFNACVKNFSETASKITVTSLVPVYGLLTFDEKTKVNAAFMEGVKRVQASINFGRSEMESELAMVRSSQGRMQGAAEASHRAAAENRAWIQNMAQTLNDMAEAMRPPPPPPQVYFFADDDHKGGDHKDDRDDGKNKGGGLAAGKTTGGTVNGGSTAGGGGAASAGGAGTKTAGAAGSTGSSSDNINKSPGGLPIKNTEGGKPENLANDSSSKTTGSSGHAVVPTLTLTQVNDDAGKQLAIKQEADRKASEAQHAIAVQKANQQLADEQAAARAAEKARAAKSTPCVHDGTGSCTMSK